MKHPTLLIIIGISGDLSRQKLLPAISKMAKAGVLPDDFRIIGITRQKTLSKEDLLFSYNEQTAYVWDHLDILSLDMETESEYDALKNYLENKENELQKPYQRLFYLSVPPQASPKIIEHLGKKQFASHKNTKILLEKPFGVDKNSAQDLVKHITTYFLPEQIYRIDHYLAKESVQNVTIFRKDNVLFKKTWNKDFIEKIEIIASEEIGINGRTVFYEQTGALRDLVQSHLLQLLALVLMKLPVKEDFSDIPEKRLEALKHITLSSFKGSALRGQYQGYKDEVQNVNSTTETFVSLSLESNDEKWKGVPFILTTGKSLQKKFTKIIISYKKEQNHEANKLIISLQPNESVALSLWVKKPGYTHSVECHKLKFTFEEFFSSLPEAYEQVLFDAMNSDHTLFTSSEEILETWRILDSVQKKWKESFYDLILYHKGSTPEEILNLTPENL
jgi:glucose-6-phosphate 1-dehydrogenase